MSPQPKTKGKPGNCSPASSRFFYPRPPLGDFTKVDAIQKQSPPTSVGGPAAVYFGASPVASALDPRLGRDPSADRFHTNMPSSSVWSKPDISTLRRIGHFYFALTGNYDGCVKLSLFSFEINDWGCGPALTALYNRCYDSNSTLRDAGRHGALRAGRWLCFAHA